MSNRWQFLFSKLAKKPCLNSFLIILSSSVSFGLWVKFKQLTIVSEKLLNYYPLSWYSLSILKSLLIFGMLWLFVTLLSLLIDQRKVSLSDNLLICSLPFMAFWLCLVKVKLLYQVGLFLIFSLIILLRKILRNKPLYHRIREPLLVFVSFVFIYLVVFVNLSPLYQSHIFNMWGRNDELLAYDYHWDSAKAFDFIGNFTQKCSLGGYAQHTWQLSQLSSFLVLLFDIPLVDLMGKYATVHSIFFAFYTFAAYGAYLLFRYGLKLSFLPSFIGGLGFILSNAAFLSLNNSEYSLHQMQFLFFPWVLFLLKKTYDLKNNALIFSGICLAGLVAALPEYVMSSQAESELLYLKFCNLFNLCLALGLFAKNRFRLRSFPQLIANIAIFPIMHFVGFAARAIPLFEALISREFTWYSLYQSKGGLPWDFTLVHWSTFFFRIPDDMVNSRLSWVCTISSPPVYFFLGYFIFPLIYCFLTGFCLYVFKIIFRKKRVEEETVLIKNSLFFLIIFLILGVNLPIGANSWLSRSIKFVGLYGVNHSVRLFIYYLFFAWASAMLGLEYLLGLKKTKILFLGFILCALSSVLAYLFLPVPKVPKGLLVDIFILIATCILLYALIKNYSKKRLRYLFGFLIILVVFLSFYSYRKQISNAVILKSNPTLTEEKIFTSFRTAATILRNNQHDAASFKYLDKRLAKFRKELALKKQKDISSCFDKIKSDDYCEKAKEYYDKIDNIFSAKFPTRLQFFETLAPEIDNFYIEQGKKDIKIASSLIEFGPLVVDNNSAVQFYLPGGYNHLAFYSLYGIGVGKNCDFSGEGSLSFSIAGALPAIGVHYYYKNLWYEAYRSDIYKVVLYHSSPFSLEHLLSNKSDKKLLNICGVDYILYPKSLERSKHYTEASDTLVSFGFVPVELPDSYRFDENVRLNVFSNPQSYTKAYIAKWVKVIKPSDNLANNSKTYSYFSHWPMSEELDKDFKYHISQIPDNIGKAVLIESSEPNDYSDKPYVYNADNDVNILKILGSKAVFDVDCQDDSCWFVYNTAALKGWKAFDFSQPLTIYKANLGFIGLKLNKGRHFLWLEYRPFTATLGFIVTLLGWVGALGLILRESKAQKKE